MLKQYVLLVIALFGFVSESQAAKPFTYTSLNDGPSVLTATQAPQPVGEVAPAQEPAVVEARPDAPEKREVPVGDAPASSPEQPAVINEQPATQAPMPESGEAVQTQPVATEGTEASSSAPVVKSMPVYRSASGYRPMYGGVLGELIELERRKNAWIRRNVFGR